MSRLTLNYSTMAPHQLLTNLNEYPTPKNKGVQPKPAVRSEWLHHSQRRLGTLLSSMNFELRKILTRLAQGEISFEAPSRRFVEQLWELEGEGLVYSVRPLPNGESGKPRWLNVTARMTNEGRRAVEYPPRSA